MLCASCNTRTAETEDLCVPCLMKRALADRMEAERVPLSTVLPDEFIRPIKDDHIDYGSMQWKKDIQTITESEAAEAAAKDAEDKRISDTLAALVAKEEPK